jgi:hypothetical protein
MDDDQIEALQRKAREILDKRNYDRFRTQLQVRFRPLGASEAAGLLNNGNFTPTTSEKGRTKETKNLFKVMTEDVSQGGLRISSPQPIAVGVILAVDLQLPQIPLPISALAEVVWTSDKTPEGCACGLRFTQINKSDLSKLERFLLLQRNSGS